MTIIHASLPTSIPLSLTLALAGIASLIVVCLSAIALIQRRSLSYLLVFLAFSALLVRTAVAWLTIVGVVPEASHHLLEHGLDFAMAGFVIVSVYYARRVERDVQA